MSHHRHDGQRERGFIPGAPHISRLKDDHEQSIIHSEVNALADCAKRGTSLSGAKIYVTHYPCINCFRSIAASSIKEIIYLHDYRNDEIVQQLAADSGITIRRLMKGANYLHDVVVTFTV